MKLELANNPAGRHRVTEGDADTFLRGFGASIEAIKQSA